MLSHPGMDQLGEPWPTDLCFGGTGVSSNVINRHFAHRRDFFPLNFEIHSVPLLPF